MRKIQNRSGIKDLRIFSRSGETRRSRNDVTVLSRPLDGAVDDLTLTDSRLLLVASALFISPILLWTLRSSILAPYVTTSALSSLPFVRANLAERVLPSSTCNDTRPSRRRSFKMLSRRRQPRDPPHHPRVQHETSLTLARYHETITFRNKRKNQRRRRGSSTGRPTAQNTEHQPRFVGPPLSLHVYPVCYPPHHGHYFFR